MDALVIIGIIIWLISRKNKKKDTKNPKQSFPQNQPKPSEWTWNEETKLWEHPLSKKSDTTYNFSKEHIRQYNTEENQETHFHIEDTAFKVPQKPKSEPKTTEKTEFVIPDNIQQLIRENKEQVDKQRKVAKNQASPKIIYTYQKTELKPSDREENNADLDFQNAYQRRTLFTRNEWHNYKKLRDIAEKRGFIICPKVRLFDLIEPRADKKKKLTYRYKIQAKHVDFVICDQDMRIKAILELDDNSHYDPDRIKRDNFVNTILLSVGYTVIHTQYIDNDIFDLIE